MQLNFHFYKFCGPLKSLRYVGDRALEEWSFPVTSGYRVDLTLANMCFTHCIRSTDPDLLRPHIDNCIYESTFMSLTVLENIFFKNPET